MDKNLKLYACIRNVRCEKQTKTITIVMDDGPSRDLKLFSFGPVDIRPNVLLCQTV